jgi:hypothetical protein
MAATQRQLEIAAAIGLSEKAFEAFLKRHEYFVETGRDCMEVEGPTGVFTKVGANWPLYHKFVDQVLGKPATAEPKPDAVDPFKELASETLTDEEIAAAISPPRKLPPPPEPEE